MYNDRSFSEFGQNAEHVISVLPQPVEQALTPHVALIHRIQLAAGLSSDYFQQYYTAAIRVYAELVHLLPASRADYHGETGGQLAKGLETAFLALQSAQARIFTVHESSERRRTLEPKWRYAAFLGGLFFRAGWVANGMRVVGWNGAVWNPLVITLANWIKHQGERPYYIHFYPTERPGTNPLSSLLLQRYLPITSIEILSVDGPQILTCLLQSLSETLGPHDSDTLLQVVRTAETAVIAHDRAKHKGRRPLVAGMRIEMYLVDAMRELTKSQLPINAANSPFFFTRHGLFVDWENAAAAIKRVLHEGGIPGIPNNPQTLAEALVEANLANPNPHTHSLFWTVCIRRADGSESTVECLKLANTETLFPRVGEPLPEVFESRIEGESKQAPVMAVPMPEPVTATNGESLTSIPSDEAELKVPQSELPLPSILKDPQSETVNPTAPSVALGRESDENTWLLQQGSAGSVLNALADDLRSGKRRPGFDVFFTDAGLAIRYPAALEGYSVEPSALASEMFDKQWLVKDTQKPLGRVQVVTCAGVQTRVLLLTKAIGARIQTVAQTSLAPLDNSGDMSQATEMAPSTPDLTRSEDALAAEFFTELTEQAMAGRLPFTLHPSPHAVIAPFPAVFTWYTARHSNMPIKRLASLLLQPRYIVFNGGLAWHLEGPNKYVWFKAENLPSLLKAQKGLANV